MCKILSRIKALADSEGVSIGTIERAIGASRGVISKAIAKGTDIQSKWLELICEKFPKYSPVWLLTGQGSMLANPSDTFAPHSPAMGSDMPEKIFVATPQKLSHEFRPRIPLDASAGGLSVALESVTERECELMPIIPTLPKYDFTITARGESMMPTIESGDELACRFINDSAFIQWGRVYVLDTAQGIVVKRIFEKDENILCRSNNKEYPDFLVSKDDIYHMALVVGLLRHF